MSHIEIRFRVEPIEFKGILIAELSSRGYNGFVEDEDEIAAFILTEDFEETVISELIEQYQSQAQVTLISKTDHEPINWNEEWEKNFEAIVVEDRVLVRATFHSPRPKIDYEIVIDPKMSFGTGHHETTYMMIQKMLELDLTAKSVLDFGCGTGILAIFSELMGAASVLGIDHENWAYQNALENVELNQCKQIEVKEGDQSSIPVQSFDIILANINKTVILNTLGLLFERLIGGGDILLSGILLENEDEVINRARDVGFSLVDKLRKNNWLCLHLQKPQPTI